MSLLAKIKEKRLATVNSNEREVVVAVPDIKEYLVREYERVADLKLINEELRQRVEEAEELKMKYDAVLVTLDEYSKRLDLAEAETARQRELVANRRAEIRDLNDAINSYKIKFNNAAVTKAELEKEIVEEVKEDIISIIKGLKGNLSKKSVCAAIDTYRKEQKRWDSEKD